MSNAVGAKARCEEEIAFLAMKRVLGIDISLADAEGIIEVTSQLAKRLLTEWVRTMREGLPQTESRSIPACLNQWAQVCAETLAT